MERNGKPALIALDFDGTLVEWRDRAFVSPETRQALAEAIEQGTLVGLCSGRRWHTMREILEGIGMRWGDPFPSFVIEIEKVFHWVRHGRLEEGEFADQNRARLQQVADLARVCLRLGEHWLEALERAGLRHSMWHLYGDYGLEVTYATTAEAEEARILLERLVESVPNACVHRNTRSAYVVPASCTKGVTLSAVARTLGIPPDRVLGVGDSLNDLDMVDGRHGLLGATLANADPIVQAAVRAAGGHVASLPAEAGVREVLRWYLQGREESP